MKKIVFVDMDNTLCDYIGAFNKKLEENPRIEFPQTQYKFFENLVPLPNAIECFKRLEEHFDMRILTAPSVNNRLCYSEKAEWVFKHLGFESQKKLSISNDKSQFRGHYLIDDMRFRGTVEFGEYEGQEFIQFGTKEFPNWLEVEKYLMGNIE